VYINIYTRVLYVFEYYILADSIERCSLENL